MKIKKKKILKAAVFIAFSLILCAMEVNAEVKFTPPPTSPTFKPVDVDGLARNLGNTITLGQYVINGIIGLGLILSLLGFAKTTFLISTGNAKKRPEYMRDLLILTATTAGLGAFPWILTLVIAIMKL